MTEDLAKAREVPAQAASHSPWMSRVYIVDDHRFFTYALTALVNNQADLTVCGVAHDEATVLEEIMPHSPDLVVLDVRMSTKGGFALAAAVRRFSKQIPILFVSSLPNPSIRADMMSLEPCSFVEKTQDPGDIILGIRRLLAETRRRQTSPTNPNTPPPT